jgi:hypothetical protein
MQTTFPSHKQLSKDPWIGVQTNVGLVYIGLHLASILVLKTLPGSQT